MLFRIVCIVPRTTKNFEELSLGTGLLDVRLATAFLQEDSGKDPVAESAKLTARTCDHFST